MTSAVVNLSLSIRRLLGRWRVVGIVLLAALLLSGCVKYDVAVNFNHEHQGAIVQHIRLGEQLTSFSNAQATEWLRSIEQRAKQLQGKTKRFSNQEIVVTVPFSNGAELATKFNQFFNPVAADASSKTPKTANLPSIDSKLNLKQRNFFVVQQNRLSYELDLRSLAVLAANGSAIVSPGSLLDLHFSLEAPWGAKTSEQTANTINPKIYNDGRKLVWTLIPGQLNRLEVVFWLPSPLGIGSIVIVLLVLGGFYLKYKSFPWIPEKSLSETTPLSVNSGQLKVDS